MIGGGAGTAPKCSPVPPGMHDSCSNYSRHSKHRRLVGVVEVVGFVDMVSKYSRHSRQGSHSLAWDTKTLPCGAY